MPLKTKNSQAIQHNLITDYVEAVGFKIPVLEYTNEEMAFRLSWLERFGTREAATTGFESLRADLESAKFVLEAFAFFTQKRCGGDMITVEELLNARFADDELEGISAAVTALMRLETAKAGTGETPKARSKPARK